MRVLEEDFRDLESQLDFTPPDPIGVILYTGESFADITRAPSWVGALNDGRMRIPVQGLTAVTPELARVLKHELTHSFIGQKTHNRAPTWLQEGVAQYMEGRRSTGAAGALLNAAGQGELPGARQPRRFLDGLRAAARLRSPTPGRSRSSNPSFRPAAWRDITRLLDDDRHRPQHRSKPCAKPCTTITPTCSSKP